MAVIGTLRNKMGTWVVVFVFVAIAAFVLGDIFSGNSSIMNWGRNSVGEIAGREISYEEFQSAIQERETSYFLQLGREPGEREMPAVRQQAWDLLISRHAVQPEFSKVGIVVTDDEVWDMIQGKNVDESVKQAFTNQETGQFERDRVVNYLNQLKTMPPTNEMRIRWELFQRDLKPGRERIKYENLLIKSNYVTKAEAEREYHAQTDVAEVKYLYVPYYTAGDSAVNVSDADLKSYYNENIERYKTEESRDIKYVSIPIEPTADDSLAIREDLNRYVQELKTAQDDSIYAAANTEGQNPYAKYTPSNLPPFVSADSLVQGKVFGPFLDGDTYKVVKISRIFDDTVSTARAKHILIKWDDPSDAGKKAAREKAQKIMQDIRNGADFGAKAREFGTDGTASRGGDLGWFSSGQMVAPFENAVFSATRPGLVNRLVETEYGYHIIDVTNVKTNRAYNIAVIERTITPSDATLNEAFRKAEAFASDVSDLDDFQNAAKEHGLTVLDAKNILAGDRRIGTMGEARPVVQWLFRDASKGKVSEVFDLQDQNVVAIMTNQVDEGHKPLDLVKEEITPAVRNKLQGKLIADKLSGMKGTLEEVKTSYGQDANVYNSSDLKLSANTLPSVGFDPLAVGVAFSLDKDQRSKPVTGENGVVVIEMLNETVAPALTDYTTYKTQLLEGDGNRTSFGIAEAIKDKADIEDKRYKFY
jgi:peptidyl-prolyl cis-trans isomerase D